MLDASVRAHLKRSRIRLMILLVGGLVLLAAGIIGLFWDPEPETYRIRVTGGIEGLNRHGVAQYLARHGRDIGLEVEIIPSQGTIEATRLVESGEIDLAIVNGLLRSPQRESIRQISAISVEALHVLVKQEFVDEVTADLGTMRDLELNIGPHGSEAELMSRAVLGFCGIPIDEQGRVDGREIDRQGFSDILATLDKIDSSSADLAGDLRATLPDVVIHVSTLPSPFAKRLIQVGEFALLPIPFADAFSKITVEEEELDRDHLDQLHVVPTTIPAFMYGASPAVPAKECPTLGCPLIVIVRNDVPNDVAARLLPRIYEGAIERVYHPPAISNVSPTYPWHPASIAYRDRNQPILKADVANQIQQIFNFLAPLMGGCLALFGYYRWRQMLRFIEYFEKYQTLDMRAKGLTQNSVVSPAEAEEARGLETELTQLQQQAVSDFCRNYFYGDGVFLNLIQLLAETRNFLRVSLPRPESPPSNAPVSNRTEPMPDSEQT